MTRVLTAQSIDIEQLKRISQPKSVEGGEEDYAAGRAQVIKVDGPSAQVTVGDTRTGKPYHVGILNHGNQITLSCTCRDSYLWVPCRHRYAAALALSEYLTAHPPKLWKYAFDQGAAAAPRRTATHNALLVFSLQDQGSGWSIAAYTLNARHLEGIDLSDRATVSAEIDRRGFTREAKQLRQRVSKTSYPLVNDNEVTVANLVINPYGNYYNGSSSHYEVVLPYLSQCLVFEGDTGEPFQAPLTVHEQKGALEAQLKQTKKGLQISAQLVVGEERIAIKPRELMVLAKDPLWLLHAGDIVQVGAVDGVASALLDNPNLIIPPEDVEEFFDQYLLPISERVKVSGDMIDWQDVPPSEPQPRLYLSERDGTMQGELRFAYGKHEVTHEKSAPEYSVRRAPGTTSFAKIKRDVAREQAIATSIASSYGFKKGSEPHILPLRANTQPIDFLLHQVPKLTAQGFEIFGEEALVSAKVNRNTPSISFKVDTGIDWFDVTAIVNYGDLQVSLKDIRQAIKKREKYVKLADGSIGALPEEFVERYRHLFNMGQDNGAGALRFNQTQLTLIDQLLGEGDRAQTDAAFEQRREKLRNFENITPQPLPPGFTGELRPYQKFGYDWLHFLQEYNFGGCLADDMGVGKCVLPDTQIFVNGELTTAEQLWDEYATNNVHDAEGEWAEARSPLHVNSLNESSKRMTSSQIKRLYRQWIKEPVRRIVLEDGSTITTTRRHRLLTNTGWSNQLLVGNYVCLPGKLIHPGANTDHELVELLAWQIAEGYEQNERSTVSITQNDLTRLTRLHELFLRVGKRYHLAVGSPAVRHYIGKVPVLCCNSTAYQRFLASRGYIWGLRSREKMIPQFIMQGDIETARVFLHHYFDAEGSVNVPLRSVELSSASPQLMNQVAALLRRFGIWMRIAEKRKMATNGARIVRSYYSGYVRGNALRLFADQIGFASEKKQQAVRRACEAVSNTNVEGIPAAHIVAEAVDTTNLPVRHFGMHNTVYINGTQQFSRESLGRVVTAIDHILCGEAAEQYRALPTTKWTQQTNKAYEQIDPQALQATRGQLQHLIDQEVFYCRIKSVEEYEYEGWVYDFEVANHHNFVANGILCHNTIQALAFLESIYHRDHESPATLIVMPRSLLFNWQREAEKFTPNLDVYVHADAGRITTAQDFDEHDIVLTTYGTMLRDVELLRGYEFHHVILDESQAIKNPLAETSKAARLLRGRHRLALTGTPIENSTAELWSQFAFLNPGLLGNLEYFRNEFVTPIERHQNGDTAQFLRRMVFPFILRRTKDQVAQDLPPRTEEIVICDMEPAQRKLYIKQRDFYRATLLGMLDESGMDRARMQVLEALLRLRQISNHPRLADAKYKGGSGKFELLMETLETLQAEGHRALVFSQFVQMLTIVREALDARGVPYAYLDGQTRDRQGQVDRFQNDDTLPFFLISLKAGGVGLNLTAADYVIHIDPWWNPAAEQQATDRTHRIGQDKPVFVTKLIARDTVEEKILLLQQHKRDLVDQIISAEGGVFKSLTREDVEVLFS